MAGKGVIVEYDFTVLDGADMLFDATKRYLMELDGIVLDVPSEARFLAGGNYQGALAQLFSKVGTKKTAAKAARELAELFNGKVTAAIPGSVTTAFRNFVKVLAGKGVKVVIATRADVANEGVKSAFDGLLGENVVLHQELSTCYGAVKWDSWRLACVKNGLRNVCAAAVTGSGCGVKSALLAGMGSLAVVNDHVAYQDFGGADAVVEALDSAAAKKVLDILRM